MQGVTKFSLEKTKGHAMPARVCRCVHTHTGMCTHPSPLGQVLSSGAWEPVYRARGSWSMSSGCFGLPPPFASLGANSPWPILWSQLSWVLMGLCSQTLGLLFSGLSSRMGPRFPPGFVCESGAVPPPQLLATLIFLLFL